jgi:hypothetical protein
VPLVAERRLAARALVEQRLEVQVKAQALFNAAKWIEREFGQSALRDVLRACSDPVRERYTTAIAINWHPVTELVEFLGVAERLLGSGDGKLSERVGEAGAQENLKGSLARAALYLANPEFMIRRVASLWSQFNDEGSMEVVKFAPELMELEVKGVNETHWLFCCTLTGWCVEAAIRLGWRSPVAKHVQCKSRGDAKCIWQIRGVPAPSAPVSRR